MRLALADIWVEKDQAQYYVKIRDGQVCNVLGPMDERSAHKIHAHLIEAVFTACLEEMERMKEKQVSQVV